MSKCKHMEAQMVSALKKVEAGRKVEDVAREGDWCDLIQIAQDTIVAMLSTQ